MADGPPTLSARTVELLRHVAAENVGWRYAGRGVSYRLWTSEDKYVLVTEELALLVERGLAERVNGWRHGRGPVELTPKGTWSLEAPACICPAVVAEDGSPSRVICPAAADPAGGATQETTDG